MNPTSPRQCIAFSGMHRIATGTLAQVALEVKRAVDAGQPGAILLFDVHTSELIDLDTRGSLDEVASRYAQAPSPAAPVDIEPETDAPPARGRPKLGVVAREVTLLPRHWEWLGGQPGGASVALRKLVEEARRANAGQDIVRLSRESSYRFLSAIASAQASFEEATRALFAGDRARYQALLKTWPADVRDHALSLAEASFPAA